LKVIGVVGYKNSGKTFIVQKLIKYFVNKKLKVASIKHAHHNFEIDKPGTDSFLHRQSGAQEVIISSSKRWARIKELKNSKEKKLSDLITQLEKTDIVIIEGFKNEKHSKLEIINEKNYLNNNYLFPSLNNVIGIICDTRINTSIKQFHTHEIEIIAEYILEKT
tara:strand:+ start:556 stop:1047 length:492 start_codon:yes stop_codon:yes gene_type:complete